MPTIFNETSPEEISKKHKLNPTLRDPYELTEEEKKAYDEATKGWVRDPFEIVSDYPDWELLEQDVQPDRDSGAYYYLHRAYELQWERISKEFEPDREAYKIRLNDLSFVETGLIAYKLKVFKIWKHNKFYKNFKHYCEVALGRSYSYIKRLIEAARVVQHLIYVGFKVLPKNEAQCRELAKLDGPELTDTWRDIVETMPEHKITAKAIRSIKGEEPK